MREGLRNSKENGCYTESQESLEQKKTELLRITNSLNIAQEVAMLGSWDYDVKKNHIYWSDMLFSIVGVEKPENVMSYEKMLEMVFPEDREYIEKSVQAAIQSGAEVDLIYRIVRPDHSLITVQVKGVVKRNPEGKVTRIIGILRDISEQIETENRYKNIFNNLDVGIWSKDICSNRIVYASPAIERLTGYNANEFLSGEKQWIDLLHPEDRKIFFNHTNKLASGKLSQYQYRIIDAFGNVKWIEGKSIPTFNKKGELIKVDGIVQDISERKQQEEIINFFAYHDYLTELPNRRKFDQKLEELIATSQDHHEHFALYFLDMDRFKFVNDTLGSEIGDSLLLKITNRLLSLGDHHEVYRIGGDEFIIIQHDLSEKDPQTFGNEILRKIQKPFKVRGYEIHITTSIGISVFPDDGDTVRNLIMNSDAALYRAKELGKNNVQHLTKSVNIVPYKRFILENELRNAILKEEFVLNYQPRVDTLSGEIVGAEALIRWNHPEWGVISPADFIPLAEETELINDISDWVINQVIRQLHNWRGMGYQLIPISINLSAKTLMKEGLVNKIQSVLLKYSILPSLIEIEITEDSLIKNEGSTLTTIEQLRELGIAITIDDFGTGYSSIGYLKKFKVDYIKIDRSFIKEILENKEDSTIVQSIILLAKGFQSKIVAENVETEEQLEFLKFLQCHHVQGFLFSKPIPAEHFTTLLK